MGDDDILLMALYLMLLAITVVWAKTMLLSRELAELRKALSAPPPEFIPEASPVSDEDWAEYTTRCEQCQQACDSACTCYCHSNRNDFEEEMV